MKSVTVHETKLKEDNRGWVVWPFPDNILRGSVANVHIPLLKPGAIRGNHYHLHTREYAMVLAGPCRAVFTDTVTGEHEEMLFAGDRPVLLRIEPGTAHAFKNEAAHDILLLCFDEKTGDSQDPDIHRHTIFTAAATS